VKLIEQVLREEPLPLHRLERRIPRDLETIVLKALAKEPGRRYTTAEQIAEDLRRFAVDRPILARRISTAERAWRWCKRNPLVAGAAGAVAAALVAVAVISVVYARAQVRATTQIKGLLSESNRLLAVRNFERGQAAFDKGEIGPGMLWMIECWRSAVEAGEPAWQRVARANLAHWRPHYRPLKAVLSRTSPILHAAFSPDSRTVITGSMDGTAQLWDAASGKSIGASLQAEGQWLHIAFDPDGKTVWTVSAGNTVQRWDAATGLPRGSPLRLRPQIHILAIAIQPDGKIMLIGAEDAADDIVRLWDPATGQPVGLPLKHPGGVSGVVLTPDGKTVLTGGRDGTFRLWDAASGQPLGVPVKHPGDVGRIMLSPDGKTIVTFIGARGQLRFGITVRLWDAVTGKPLGLPMRHESEVRAVEFSPDGRTVFTGGRDGTAGLWDAATGKPAGPPMRHESGVWAAAFSPDGKTLLTGYQNNEARLWDAATAQLIGLLEHQGGVKEVAFSPDGTTVLTRSLDGTVRLWDAEPGKPVGPVVDIPSSDAVRPSPDGKVLVSYPREPNYQRYIQLWNATTRQLVARLLQPGGNYGCVFSPDGKALLTVHGDDTARLWDATTGAALGAAVLLPSPVMRDARDPFRLGPDGKALLFEAKDNTVWICDLATGTVRGHTPPLGGTAYGLEFSPDGTTFLTGLISGEVQLWDTAKFAPLGKPFSNRGVVMRLTFSPDGKSVLIGHEDGNVWLWDLASRKPLIPPLRHLSPADGEFSPDGKAIVTGGTNTGQVWDAATGQPVGPVLRHAGPVSALLAPVCWAFLAHGKMQFTSIVSRPFPMPPDVPDELERVAAWVEVTTGLRLDTRQGLIQVLDNAAWLERRDRLMQLGGPPETGPEERLDAILFGPDPAARARSFIKRQQWDAAEAAFDEAMRARPFNISLMVERGDLYASRGLWSEAAAYYTRTVKQFPEIAPLHEQLAVTRLLAGDLPGYRAACAEMLERFKPLDDSTAAIRVANACSLAANAVSDLPGLIEVSERSTRWVASNERAVGAALFRAGRLEEALECFEQVHKVSEPRAWDWLFLAMIHSRLGHASEARRFLQQADQWITEADKAQSATEGEAPRWSSLTERPTILLLRSEAEAVVGCDRVLPADRFTP
jgi:WD40 repeat protein/tetratricopeptide (TPR) repeat protein